jgi:hypothetical protein
MGAKTHEAMVEMAAELDRCEQECLMTDKLLTAGLPIGDAARRQHEQWVREGKPLWRETPTVVARARKAAKRAAKNARRKGRRP